MKDVSILTNNGVDIKKSLELFGDMNTYENMLEEFLNEVEGKINNSKKYKETSDMTNYAIVVHSLKSDCRYFGMEDLANMFYEHELAGKRNDIAFVEANYDKLMNETSRMINILKKYMGILVEEPVEAQVIKVQDIKNDSISEFVFLVVDDSNIVRDFIAKIFNGRFRVVTANDGQEAISVIDNTPHEKIMGMFLDLNMPGVDGFQVLEHLKSSNLFKDIPVSIITGADDNDTIMRAFTYPIVDMIKKPFDVNQIKAVAEKTISRK